MAPRTPARTLLLAVLGALLLHGIQRWSADSAENTEAFSLPQAVRNAAAASMMASILATSTPALAEEDALKIFGEQVGAT